METELMLAKEYSKRMLMLIRADLEILKTLATDIDPTKLDFATWATLERMHDILDCAKENVRQYYCQMASKKAGNEIVYMIDEEGFPGWREKVYFEAKNNNKKNPIST